MKKDGLLRFSFVCMEGTDPDHWLFKILAEHKANVSVRYPAVEKEDWMHAGVYAFERIDRTVEGPRLMVRETNPLDDYNPVGQPFILGFLEGAEIAIW